MTVGRDPAPEQLPARTAGPVNGATAFARYSDDRGAHLADATWGAPEYEYDHIELPSSLLSPGQARVWADRALPGSGLSGAEHDDVMLVISELVTNAVLHARCETVATVTIRLAASSDCIRIEVSDRGAGFAPSAITRPAPTDPGGRGLFVIDAIAARWGTACVERHCVWFERGRPDRTPVPGHTCGSRAA
jgi:anti-sigma regulatory factor (Ser/Thr protein kinase)